MKAKRDGTRKTENQTKPKRKGIEAMSRNNPVPPYDFRDQSKTPMPERSFGNRGTKLVFYQARTEIDEEDDDSWNLDSDAAEQTMAALRGAKENQNDGRICEKNGIRGTEEFPNAL